jgi:hypothetical protein
MPTFRIFYIEHEGEADEASFTPTTPADDDDGEGGLQTEWEETVEARNASAALEAFFGEHVSSREEVRIIDEDGDPRSVGGTEEFDPDRMYIWVENGKVMEYQGMQEATPGMVTCPLCDGAGEVDEEVSQQFLEEWEQV